jgi:hypothetical protein
MYVEGRKKVCVAPFFVDASKNSNLEWAAKKVRAKAPTFCSPLAKVLDCESCCDAKSGFIASQLRAELLLAFRRQGNEAF